jgi:hypothetical protein
MKTWRIKRGKMYKKEEGENVKRKIGVTRVKQKQNGHNYKGKTGARGVNIAYPLRGKQLFSGEEM